MGPSLASHGLLKTQQCLSRSKHSKRRTSSSYSSPIVIFARVLPCSRRCVTIARVSTPVMAGYFSVSNSSFCRSRRMSKSSKSITEGGSDIQRPLVHTTPRDFLPRSNVNTRSQRRLQLPPRLECSVHMIRSALLLIFESISHETDIEWKRDCGFSSVSAELFW